MLGYRKAVSICLYPHQANFALAGSSTQIHKMLLAYICSSLSVKAQFLMREVQTESKYTLQNTEIKQKSVCRERSQTPKLEHGNAPSSQEAVPTAEERKDELSRETLSLQRQMRCVRISMHGSKHNPNVCE